MPRVETHRIYSKSKMNFKNTITTAFGALRVHKSRSALTILGIVIGVAAIIIVMSLGSGAQVLILDQISGLGAETVVVRPGTSAIDITTALFSRALTEKDVDALKKKSNVPNLVSIAPFVIVSSTVEYQGDSYRPSIFGGSAEFMSKVYDFSPDEGYLYNENDIESYARVAVIGSELRDKLFENRNALGENVRVNDRNFRVVGVFPDVGSIGGFNFNNMMMIPHTTAQRYVTGSDYYNELILTADSANNVDKMVFDVTATLRETHEIDFGEDNDFNVQTQQNLVDQISLVTSILTAFLAAVVAISLIVGGIGIMNIMLVSVTERTKEIGLRKALGATRKDILRQFLYEAVMLTSIGGLIGIIIGALVSFGVSLVLAQTVAEDWSFTFPVSAAIIGLAVSGGVGLVFGIYPANQAAKKSPMEALRYE